MRMSVQLQQMATVMEDAYLHFQIFPRKPPFNLDGGVGYTKCQVEQNI